MVRLFFWALKWTLIISVTIFMIHVWLITKSYLISPDKVAKITYKHAGKDVQQSFNKIYKELESTYPGHILPESDHQWMFVNAGGWMGAMCLVHASLTEYVLFFGTAVETSGHSGRYWANITDTLITGEMRQWSEGSLKAKIFKSGDTVYHYWGEATAIHFQPDTWMVEYGRGFIPSALPFALSDSIFSSQDLLTVYYLLRIYVKALYMEAVNTVVDMKSLLV